MQPWQSVGCGLWGEDWIAPLSEVLSVNRRTVERWKSGEIAIPKHIADDLIRLPRLGNAQRAYGQCLRELASGLSIEEIEDRARDYRRAATRLRADIGRFNAIAVLAARGKWVCTSRI
jgi:hypothetical protein